MSDLIIWDSSVNRDVKDHKPIIYWVSNGKPLKCNEYFINDLVEENPKRYKELYLEWLENLSTQTVASQELKSFFLLEKDINYWWMLTLNEKSNYDKSDWIDNVIKLFALADFIKNKKINAINLLSKNLSLSEALHHWCSFNKISFNSNVRSYQTPTSYFKCNIFLSLSWMVKYLYQRRSLFGRDGEFFSNAAEITFFSYLFNVGEFNNKFESVYWGPLVNVLRDSNKKINWIHIYPGDSTLPSLESAKLVIDGYNKKSSDLGNHALVDSFLSLKVVLRAISYWVKVIVADIKVRKYIKNTQINGFPIWPFFKREWNESIYGKSAIYYLLMLSIFEKITKNLSTQKLGVYLYENQRWEYGLLQMWRKFNHSKIVGYAHSSISFWQLRYYHCMKSIYSENILSRPLPCLIATNGASSFNYLKDGGFPEIKMIQIEALRYFHLMDAECNSELPYKNRLNNKGIAEKETFHLLVFGDLSKKRNDLHLKILENAIASSTMKIAATIKPHPGNPVIKEKLISRQITISNQPIHELLNDPKFNVAYVSSSTSSALDAYCAGFKVITSLDGELLNQSPLRDIGGDDVKFIMNEIQLNSILELYVGSVRGKKNHDIFNLDPNLSAWKNLLNISNFSNS